MKSGKHALCGVTKKDGTPCGNLAGTGTTHKGKGPCKWHGGTLVNSKKHQALVAAKEQVGALAPAVADADVTEMGHVREALRESISRLRGWRQYLATLSITDLLTTEGMFVVDAERKERMAGARVAMYAQHMGLTQLQIQVEQAQIMELGDALMAVLDAYEGGHASHAQRGLMGALLRQQDYMLNGGEDPDELARLTEQVAAARAAIAGDDAVVDAEVVPESDAEPEAEPEPPLTVPADWSEPT
jgi:hypothetical protein